ncbi:MAG: phosphoribosyl-AMP cyclohydrolase [Candidatus Omnitrophota bacterium]|nr:phosphoribosyl-AMP cyclohydrolase [Candidatus Omnitrophota bacterium]
MKNFIANLKFDEKGLIPAVIQDYKNNEVLMVAFMNNEAVKKTITTGRAHFYSRSRKKLWLKGETSGHIQKVKEIRFDCDADCILVKVQQIGGACHTGYRSCFYRKLKDKKGNIRISGKKMFDPEKVYKK